VTSTNGGTSYESGESKHHPTPFQRGHGRPSDFSHRLQSNESGRQRIWIYAQRYSPSGTPLTETTKRKNKFLGRPKGTLALHGKAIPNPNNNVSHYYPQGCKRSFIRMLLANSNRIAPGDSAPKTALSARILITFDGVTLGVERSPNQP